VIKSYQYTCESCGLREYLARILQCGCCGIPICRRCYKNGVCINCETKLLPKEKKLLKKQENYDIIVVVLV